MKRTGLVRHARLARKTRLRVAVAPSAPTDAERAWKTPRWGRCENCGLIDIVPLHGHHVLARQVLARIGADEWDARNRMGLCAKCHLEHEFGQINRKIRIEKLPARALAFVCEVLGEEQAADYLRRRYAP